MKIQQQIEQTLQTAFTPTFLEVINESDGHNVPRGSESHFKVIIVSDVFINTSRIKRHKMIYSAAAAEVEQIHAFSVSAFDISEWSVKKGEVAQSPPCLGGEK